MVLKGATDAVSIFVSDFCFESSLGGIVLRLWGLLFGVNVNV